MAELPELSPAIIADWEALGPLDLVRAWPFDRGRDGVMDTLVQAALPISDGGNGVVLRHFLYEETDEPLIVELPLNAGTASVEATGETLILTLATYLEGDGACCPTGTDVVELRY